METLTDRLKTLRKTLDLTLKNFGESIGLKTGSYNDIEKGRCALTERNKTLICQTFNVNPVWLETGQGDMFLKGDNDIINDLAIQYNLDTIDIEILTAYINLPAESRSIVKDFIKLINKKGK